MMRLTKVELRRLFARRLTSIAILGALLVTGFMLFTTFEQAKPLSSAELTSARAMFDQAQKDWAVSGEQQVADCLTQQTETQKTDPKANFGCNTMEPKLENYGKPEVKFAEIMPGLVQASSYLLAFVAFLIGAGFVAAEFSSGSMANWLTFEPRRMRVYGSKLGAAGLGVVPIAVAILGLLTAGVWVIVSHYVTTGGTVGATRTLWFDLGEMAGRSVALAVVSAALGAAVGVLLRHTAAVLGVAIGYLVLVEAVLGQTQALRAAKPWLLQLNVDAWLQHGAKYYIDKTTPDGHGNYVFSQVEKVLSFGHGTAYLGGLAVVIVGLAAVVFRRRDVS